MWEAGIENFIFNWTDRKAELPITGSGKTGVRAVSVDMYLMFSAPYMSE